MVKEKNVCDYKEEEHYNHDTVNKKWIDSTFQMQIIVIRAFKVAYTKSI